jgi:hypothetical protein
VTALNVSAVAPGITVHPVPVAEYCHCSTVTTPPQPEGVAVIVGDEYAKLTELVQAPE